MSHTVDLEALKRKLYMSYHQDGILDLAVGLSILGFGISMAMDVGVTIVFAWIGLILYAPLKSAITISRMGYVQFETEAKQKSNLLYLLLLGLGVLALFFGLVAFLRSDNLPTDFEGWLRQYHMLLLGALPAVALTVTAWRTGVSRLLVDALLIIGIILVGIWLQWPEPTYVMVTGGVLSLIGFGLLARFVRKYPVQKEDGYDVR
ncbi:MAG: hypothetical protein H6652_09415 [Ardenticatenaceae bacterium]|nr:hypothetical protein [Ardenticatenaceae bacterium]